MRFNDLVKLSRSYLYYFLHATDQHGIQSPKLFQLYQSLFRRNESSQNAVKEAIAYKNALVSSRIRVNKISFGVDSQLGAKGQTSVSSIARHGTAVPRTLQLLANAVKVFKPETMIELGTSLGISTSCMALSNPTGKVVSFEGNGELCKLASDNLEQRGIRNVQIIPGNIDETLPDWLKTHTRASFFFLDANHSLEATLRYFDWLSTCATSNSLFIIDDIRWSAEMLHAWEQLKMQNGVTFSMDYGSLGLLFYQWEYSFSQKHFIFE